MWIRRISLLLALAAVVWCAWAGVRIWKTPIVYQVYPASTDPAVPLQEPPSRETRSFAALSPLGALPLVLPLLLAAGAALAAWRRRAGLLLLAAVLLLGYSSITGFSLGGAYGWPACLLAGAGLLALIHSRSRRNLGDPATS